MNIVINAKVKSISENNNFHIFEPNDQGFYNVSLLFSVFNKVKEAQRRIEEADSPYLEQSCEAIYRASEMFFTYMSEGLKFYKLGNEYWSDRASFELALRSCSDLFSKGDCGLEQVATGEIKNISYNDHALLETLKYSVFRFEGGETIDFKANCIFNLSRIRPNLEFVHDFVVAHDIHFTEQVNKYGLSGDAQYSFYREVWMMCYQQVQALISHLNQFDPNLQDFESFMLKYRHMIAVIGEKAPAIAASYSIINVQPVKKTFLQKLFGG